MTTTINNDLRVFMIVKQGWQNKTFFCNMHDIEKCINELEKHDDYKVFEFWNFRQKSVSRKTLKSYLEANQLNSSFIK